ncbi:hypothetical protein IEQ34_014314 [Dendrobium chrysotoxum]|uniref:Uncharacterized protein n=1 Tax=Dendrobium chrysotoxum TaxID=161865 RepID=A0AAV7GLN1_DENCH|nr:hypothetical protein IEQ34_014314 [Dendrobium chrysotoxum]
MASGDDRQRGLIKNIFGRRSKKAVVSRPARTEGTSSSQPATESQPSPPIPTPAASSPQFYSPDPHLPSPDLTQTTPFYPYYPPPPYHGAHPPYSSYVPPPPQAATAPSQPATARPSCPAAAVEATEGRMLIEPDVLGREPTPVELHSHTHKRQEDQQWIDERARRAYIKSQAAAGEGSSAGSTDYSDYRTWSQAIASLTAELEQVQKAQADWQMQMQQQQIQMQQQQAQMLEEMRKMREQMSSGRSTA